MSTRSSIDRHPERERIIEAIANGVAGVQIARRYGVSESAISRYRISREHIFSQIVSNDAADPTEVLGRLLDLSDSARVARKLADVTGSPAVRARVIATELSVLDKLTKIGVDDTATARLQAAVGPLVRAIRHLAESFPREVLAELAKYEELEDLRTDLKSALRAQRREES